MQIVADAHALAVADVQNISLQALSFGDVADRNRPPARLPGVVLHLHHEHQSPEPAAVTPHDPVVVLVAIVRPARQYRLLQRLDAYAVAPNLSHVLANDFILPVPQQSLGARVPRADVAFAVEHEKCLIVHAVHEQAELLAAAHQLGRSFGDALLELFVRQAQRVFGASSLFAQGADDRRTHQERSDIEEVVEVDDERSERRHEVVIKIQARQRRGQNARPEPAVKRNDHYSRQVHRVRRGADDLPGERDQEMRDDHHQHCNAVTHQSAVDVCDAESRAQRSRRGAVEIRCARDRVRRGRGTRRIGVLRVRYSHVNTKSSGGAFRGFRANIAFYGADNTRI